MVIISKEAQSERRLIVKFLRSGDAGGDLLKGLMQVAFGEIADMIENGEHHEWEAKNRDD